MSSASGPPQEEVPALDTTTSLYALAAALLAAGVALLGHYARRRQPLAGHALFPWTGLLFVALIVAAALAAHLLGVAPTNRV